MCFSRNDAKVLSRCRPDSSSIGFRENHRLVVFVLVRIRDFAGINATSFLPAQESNHTENLVLIHRCTKRTHRSAEILGDPSSDRDVNIAVGVARIFEHATRQTWPLRTVTPTAMTECAASPEPGLTGFDNLHVVGRYFHVVLVRLVLRSRR